MHHPKWHINSGLFKGMKDVNLACFKTSGVFGCIDVYLLFVVPHISGRGNRVNVTLCSCLLLFFFFLPYLCREYGCSVRSRFVIQWDVPALGQQAKVSKQVIQGIAGLVHRVKSGQLLFHLKISLTFKYIF